MFWLDAFSPEFFLLESFTVDVDLEGLRKESLLCVMSNSSVPPP